ncbi:membrane protein [Nitzschia inconspicua]|uniref:Membrane protein n=1 Tax=Nitzschia inconspicua TaxID=303405 RepID=A0A9K3Q0D4_9STRA|nr:membrane protein [Nitzschia inconspicua]
METTPPKVSSVIETLAAQLEAIGITELCHPTRSDLSPSFPLCNETAANDVIPSDLSSSTLEPLNPFDIGCSILCLVIAAICAGLILGILSLDELYLHVKARAAESSDEQKYAKILLPLVQQRHLVLVSLLLLNFAADETLPLFLDRMFPSWMAITLSVVLVVFVSEIIPSAVFTGPNQLRLAALVSPFCRFAIIIMYPISFPIAKCLDWLLQEEDELGNVYNRGELAAMVRIQYESRMAAKRRAIAEWKLGNVRPDANIHGDGYMTDETEFSAVHHSIPDDLPSVVHQSDDNNTLQTTEVNVVEGALSLQVTRAKDVCTTLRKTYTLPIDTVLDQQNMARIYGVGYSRVPIYQRNPHRPRDTSAIVGVLMTRQLILIQPGDRRPISSMPLYVPSCVAPDATLVELLHLFQGGSSGNKGGHMALVCEKPSIANAALEKRHPIPSEAGVLGIVTLEDIVEEIIQEPIYDEGDRAEREAMQRAEWAFNKWKMFVRRRKRRRESFQEPGKESAQWAWARWRRFVQDKRHERDAKIGERNDNHDDDSLAVVVDEESPLLSLRKPIDLDYSYGII